MEMQMEVDLRVNFTACDVNSNGTLYAFGGYPPI